ncbi:MAG: hypothetical protein S4CHLAM2_09750 [Chlamydiales bacterium]|nr:hypothetical protein [Chlamydiales bacterium]
MMEIMVLSRPSKALFDPIRKKWVEATPEETIRQELVKKMIQDLGFPSALIAVERELAQLPHLQLTQREEIPKRRADLIVFAKNIHPDHDLFPLLMIECKAVALTPRFAQQVVGYNACVQAPFLALANGDQVMIGAFDRDAGHTRFQPGLPAYTELLSQVLILL